MAITFFQPEIWSANILVGLRNLLVYGQPGIINRDYEGDLAQAGDTVHIVSFNDPAVRNYTKNTDITWDLLTDIDRTLVVDQGDYFAFTVDDIDKRQALPGFIASAAQGAAYNLADAADSYLSGIMSAGVDAGNDLGAVAVNSPDSAYGLLIDLRTALTKAAVPSVGRWVVVPPELYAYLLQDNRFIDASASGSTEALRNGVVGRAAGFDVLESNTVPSVPGPPVVHTVLAGHGIATTFAEQIVQTEAIRLQDQFGDGVRGLHLYGGKVTRPTALASADATIS